MNTALALLAAHPYGAAAAFYALLNVLNGLLPATIRSGPVGTAIHLALDRVSATVRRNAPGTLKWPVIAGSILRAVADSLNPPSADVIVLDGRTTLAPPRPIDPRAGHATLGTLVATLVVCALFGAALAACPRLPANAGCQPMAQTCVNGSPHVCSASQRWERSGDTTCAAVGASCAVSDAGVASCVASVVDGGAP